MAQRNPVAYEALAEQTGLDAQDCLALATIFVSRKPDLTLAWVDRGIDLERTTPHGSGAGYDLGRLRRELLTRLGTGDEALDAAWAEYRKSPSKFSFDDLMKVVPKAARAGWRQKALDAAKGADLHSVMELMVQTKEMERLAELVRVTNDGNPYLSGAIESTRVDAKALGLVPLGLEQVGIRSPAEHYWGEEGDPIEEWAKPVIARGPRPEFEMEQVLPGLDVEDPFSDPIGQSNDRKDSGDFDGAYKILMDLCQADLRCLDAHSHLGNFVFDHRPEDAIRLPGGLTRHLKASSAADEEFAFLRVR